MVSGTMITQKFKMLILSALTLFRLEPCDLSTLLIILLSQIAA